MTKFEIAAALQEIGLRLRVKGEDQYRSRAYTKAAQAMQRGSDFPVL
jgi:DNA polymerase/3'-5' exonuclease PolX